MKQESYNRVDKWGREGERESFNLLLLLQVKLHYEYYKLISLALLLLFKDEVSQEWWVFASDLWTARIRN